MVVAVGTIRLGVAAVSEITLTTSVERLAGIGHARAKALRAMGLTNVGRLIAHLPIRHEKHEAEASIKDLPLGRIASARGDITATRVVRMGRRPRLEAVLIDPTGRLDIVWFNGVFLADKIRPGMRLIVQGEAKQRGPIIQMVNPSFQILEPTGDEPGLRERRIRPVYPASEAISSRDIERIIGGVLASALPKIEDHLGEGYRKARALPSLAEAYRMMHDPRGEGEFEVARRRLAYDELLLLQLAVHLERVRLRERCEAPALKFNEAVDSHIRARFPFSLTPGQELVVREIARDLSRPVPANRLIQGDVGSGKTVVALYAMLMAVASRHQAALMAPTEILAEQHHATVLKMLEGSRVRVELLTGSTPRAERTSVLTRLAEGEVDIVVGTHALLTEDVRFASLAVAVIDEQHRFGVHQRARLRSKGGQGDEAAQMTPHVLVMTATPIPRTLALTIFGDVDISVIQGLPPGRVPIATRVVEAEKREEVYSFVRQRIERGEQAYIVVPAIDSVGATREGLVAVRPTLRMLEEGALRGRKVAALHGQLKRATRDHVMERFRAGAIEALVATTVIEVGVDVPNASVMVIESAERFGLAQLHQLRGRIGRGTRRGVCVLIAENATPDAMERLKAVAATTDGFVIAEKDFSLRGFGAVAGAAQSGMTGLSVADLSRDVELLKLARKDAAAWVAASPELDRPEDALIRRRLWKAHGEAIALAKVG